MSDEATSLTKGTEVPKLIICTEDEFNHLNAMNMKPGLSARCS
jgi:hypothetical protein